MAKKSVSFLIDEDDLKQVETYSLNLERDRTWILNQAVKMWLLSARAEEHELAEAEAAIERGEGIPHEEVFQRFADRKAS